MGKYVYTVLVGVIILIGAAFIYQRKEINKYKNLYNKELQNVEAYKASNSGLEDNIIQYQMTIDDLRASKDSIDKKLTEVIDELKVKDKKVQYLQYQTKTIQKVDTIQTLDTIFVSQAHIDTTIGDEWYRLNLKLDYPSTIIASPTFSSEQYVVINTKREYNKIPSKLFFVRWFQKKHTVTEVNVEEKNPYITNKENKFIKITK